MEGKLESLIQRLEVAVTKIEGAGGAAGPTDNETEEYPQVMAYDERFGSKMDSMMAAAKAISPELEEMSSFIKNSFLEVRRLVLLGARLNKPDDFTKTSAVFKPLADIQVAGFKWCKDHFRTPHVNHEKAVHEALTIFDWPVYGPSAGNFVGDMLGAVEMYVNKIAMEFRGKNDDQMKWVAGVLGALKALPEYISDFHKTGLSWSSRAPKVTAPTSMKGAAAPAAAPAPAPAAKKVGAGLAIPVRTQQKTPSSKLERPGVYMVEYYTGADPPPLVAPEMRDTVNFFQCKDCTLTVPMKVKGIAFLNCERVTVVFGDVIGMAEFTSCKRVTLHLTGAIKGITIDKCDTVQINLNEASIDVQITCALSQGLNVEVPDLTTEGNMIEFAVPDQFRVSVKDRKLVTVVYTHQ